MRYSFLILAFFFSLGSNAQNSPAAKASKNVRKFLDEAYYLVKLRALYSDSINWKEMEKKFDVLSRGMTTIEEARSLVDTLIQNLRRAGDHHSFYEDPAGAQKLLTASSEIVYASSSYLGDGIGYIKIPAFDDINPGDINLFASDIQRRIRQLDEGNNIEGWVVDLRGDRGGNGHPMVKGLSALIGEGVYAYASFHKKVIPMSTLADQGSAIKLESPYRVKNPSNKIAVLIDSNTGSSGELTAIAFKTLPNVKFFGQPSAGYTTANSTIKLSDGSILFLAIGYMTDRNMNKYIPNIVPDVITSAIMEYSTDPTIAAAKSWLRMK